MINHLDVLPKIPQTLIHQNRQIQERAKERQHLKHHRYCYEEILENDVRKVQDEVTKLEQQVERTSAYKSRLQTPWGAATEYFCLFRRGFQSRSDEVYKRVLNSLVSFMTPDVPDAFVCGLKAILARWMMFSLYFMLSMWTYRVWRTADSVDSLADKLLDQQLEVRESVVFECDNTISHVSKMQSQADMLTPLLQVLRSLEHVSRLFVGALVTPDSSWPQGVL
ncbi:hypothetical protein PHMEG_00027569 [Phytophthora megakarya]|uniref:Bzip transcription factor n=1 Tax=Phytophthora megakarya TaxID=4795 RepID=A0A225V6M4_9STRA|nr:hypothetical protein PHMEG_00027569 [Phytophthora megakarya]